MILKEFKTGWQEAFEPKVQALLRLFPDTAVKIVYKKHGLLKIVFEHLDKDMQYVLDCVSYKLERESSRICEECGKYGVRRELYLSEKTCLCWKCYALEVDRNQSETPQ